MNERILRNRFILGLVRDWEDHKCLVNESVDRYKEQINHDLKDKKLEYCDNKKNLDFKVLKNDEKELYLDTFDRQLREACDLIKKQHYTSNAMFMSKLDTQELLLMKRLLLNQLKEIDMIIIMKARLESRDCILANRAKREIEDDDNEIGWPGLHNDDDDDD